MDDALDDLEAIASSEELDKLLGDAAILGDDTRHFLTSHVGRSLVERAKNDLMKAMLALIDADLDGGLAKARELQIDARAAKKVIAYLAENIRTGEQALTQLEMKQKGN